MAALTLALPSTSLAATRPISTVVLSPLPLASILDHHLRRGEEQDRVFGTLLGVRRELDNEVEIRNAFGVPYEARGEGEVTVDMDHHKSLLDLHLKINPKEVVVGWYATSPTLNSFSALIHNFYTSESSPSPAIHLTLDPTTLSFTAYTASPIGTISRPDHLAFLPVESIIRVHEQERGGIDLLTSNITALHSASTAAALTLPTDSPVQTPLATLYSLLNKVSIMLDQVIVYVNSVAAGEIPGDEKVGRALMETVGVAPSHPLVAGTKEGKSGEGSKGFEEDFNTHLADVLMVSYLANLVKTQTEISSRLNLLV